MCHHLLPTYPWGGALYLIVQNFSGVHDTHGVPLFFLLFLSFYSLDSSMTPLM